MIRRNAYCLILNTINNKINNINHSRKIRLYHENVIKHFEKPKNVGTFDKNDPNVGSALIGAPACGDVLKLQIRVNPKTMVIEDACFKTFGCGSAISSSSYSTELIKKMTLDQALNITNKDIAKELNLPPVKLHCSMLAEDAIQSAVNDFKKKNNA